MPNNSMDYAGLETGYRLQLGRFGLMPYLMAGMADVSTTRDVNDGFTSPYLGLGVQPYVLVYRMDDADLVLGVDVRYLQSLVLIDNFDNASPAMAAAIYAYLGACFF